MENRPLLITCTGLHHLATAAWIGGLPWLLLIAGRDGDEVGLLRARRFSRLAIVSVLVLAGAGTVLARAYVGTADALYGTTFGVMLAAKLVLFGLILALGAANFRLLRAADRPDSIVPLLLRRSLEVETAIGIAAILVASSMASRPPAVDLPEGRVSLPQIAERFTPRWPRLQTPPITALSPPTPLDFASASATGAAVETNSPGDIAWSEYNHNWAGICLLAAGLLALIAQLPHCSWAKHWPLAFLGLGFFILVRADPENWPLGPRGFWASFAVPDVIQHRLAAVLAAAFAIFEWRVSTGRSRHPWQALVFPAICMAGGALLFLHTHSLVNLKEELLAEGSHTAIAIFAITAAGARWLQLRLPRAPASLGFAWAVCFLMIGLVLTCYREA